MLCPSLFIDRILKITWTFNFSTNNSQDLAMKLRRWTRKLDNLSCDGSNPTVNKNFSFYNVRLSRKLQRMKMIVYISGHLL